MENSELLNDFMRYLISVFMEAVKPEIAKAVNQAVKGDSEQADRIIHIDEVCELTALKKSTIYQHTSNGTIPCWRRGKRLYFSLNAINDWIRQEQNLRG